MEREPVTNEPPKHRPAPISARAQRWMERRLGQQRLPLAEFDAARDKELRKALRSQKANNNG